MMKKLGTMDLILLVIGVFLALFTTVMTVIHCVTGSTPDILIDNVFKLCGVEGGVMGVIKSVKILNLRMKHKSKDKQEMCEEIHDITDFLEEE